MGVIKYVDFGAAKVLAKNQRTIQRTRIANNSGSGSKMAPGLAMNNSLTGTPMYMAPEVIRNDVRGRSGAMDIWSLGCVILECATGRKPWSNLDNEWYTIWFPYIKSDTHSRVQGNYVPDWDRYQASASS